MGKAHLTAIVVCFSAGESPRKRRAPGYRQRRLRSAREGELVQLDGSPHVWLEGRGPRLTALGVQDDATGKILAAQFLSLRNCRRLPPSAAATSIRSGCA